ncbi:hypothetical protein LUCX_216 [Xanthomonas phage vB_XciM_LucasX]|nr:hypothetical protein LUCX_216 [Xanthomonas phage vB_XciM_LucasX]
MDTSFSLAEFDRLCWLAAVGNGIFTEDPEDKKKDNPSSLLYMAFIDVTIEDYTVGVGIQHAPDRAVLTSRMGQVLAHAAIQAQRSVAAVDKAFELLEERGQVPERITGGDHRGLTLTMAKDLLYLLEKELVSFWPTVQTLEDGSVLRDWVVTVICNDTFYHASSDSTHLPFDQIAVVRDLVERFGVGGANAWSAQQRNQEVLWFWNDDQYQAAKTYLSTQH